MNKNIENIARPIIVKLPDGRIISVEDKTVLESSAVHQTPENQEETPINQFE